MRAGPYLAVLIALLCVLKDTSGDPLPKSDVDSVPTETRINPRFYVKVDDKRSISTTGTQEDDITGEEETEPEEDADEEDEEDIDEDDAIETYYPVSDDNGQTYLIPESVLQIMAEKQQDNDDSDTYLVPNGSVRLDDDEDEDGESGSAIILSEESPEETGLADGTQYIAIIQEPETFGKSRRVQVRRGGVIRRRRAGGQRRRHRRGGSRKRLKRRRTRKRIRRGGGARGGRRRRRGGRRGGRIRLGRVRMRRRRGYGVRF